MDVLDPERWRVIGPHLDRLLDLDEQQRAVQLATISTTDAALAAELRMLLDEHRELAEQRFLEDTLPRPAPAGLAGRTIGAYTLLSPIGQGGMGAVWLAMRSDGRFDRRVAVKFLNIALGGRGEERFKREGTLLARLTHPNIAQIVDAGLSDAGQPFIILEHVDGEPIDRYCDSHRLTVDARVRLFLDVLAAVAHAHANLIVHRDIKPSNVFVDREGRVKLLDFGIAKLIEGDSHAGGAMLPTRDEGSALTPEYAAPEQMTGGAITTATDVYALGVLLYVLLAGRHPAGDALGSAATLIKAIVDIEPPRMSAVAPPGLQRQLRGDLDTIVAKSLRKSPQERYLSVTALADDLTRYLEDQPISARRESLGYRAAKFVRRNWLPVGAAALTIAAMSAGLFVANRERAVAERRFGQLRQLSNNVIALDKSIRNLAGSTQARQTLVADSLEYLEGLAAEAGSDLDLSLELGEAYWRIGRIQGVPTELNLGDYAKAEENLKKAAALVERVFAARPTSRAAVYDSGIIAHDRMILAQSERRNADAQAHARRASDRLNAFARRNDLSKADRAELSAQFGNIALAYLNMRMYADAGAHARRAIELAQAGSSSVRTAAGLSLLASILRYQGDIDGAVESITRARATSEAGAAENENETTRMLDSYGVLLRQGLILGEDEEVNAGQPDRAVEALQRALDLTEQAVRRDAHDSVSRSRTATIAREMGNILRRQNPQHAIDVYDLGLKRLSEIPSSLKAKRDQAMLLANSSYPLRALSRRADARRRIDAAVALLKVTKDYPADTLRFDAEAYTVLRADADDLAENGRVSEAAEAYDRLIEKLAKAIDGASSELRVAVKLSAFYASQEAVYRRDRQPAKADQAAARRLQLWHDWDARLPRNPYIARQLAAASSA